MSIRSEGWVLYDAIVRAAELRDVNPWTQADDNGSAPTFRPDYDTLEKLLAVPVALGATSQSGVPALALDVWVAYELRRADFDPDSVWPRESVPRVLSRELSLLLTSLTRDARAELAKKLTSGTGLSGIVSASANVLGKNYVKQVDVGISRWQTGPELMISTKRMDSSFAKNAANRVEESYGDAKNLRLRHPLAALGFVYGLRSTALTEEPDKTAWLQDLLIKLGREDDAYDAVALIVPEWDSSALKADTDDDSPFDDPLRAAGLIADDLDADTGQLDLQLDTTPPARPATQPPTASETIPAIDALPRVRLRHDAVPDQLNPGRFFAIMIRRILDNSPINFHVEARRALREPVSAGPSR